MSGVRGFRFAFDYGFGKCRNADCFNYEERNADPDADRQKIRESVQDFNGKRQCHQRRTGRRTEERRDADDDHQRVMFLRKNADCCHCFSAEGAENCAERKHRYEQTAGDVRICGNQKKKCTNQKKQNQRIPDSVSLDQLIHQTVAGTDAVR